MSLLSKKTLPQKFCQQGIGFHSCDPHSQVVILYESQRKHFYASPEPLEVENRPYQTIHLFDEVNMRCSPALNFLKD